jgi:hypothetical protein
MTLSPGLTVVLDRDTLCDQNKLRLSDGVSPAPGASSFDADAVVPAWPTRQLQDAERAILMGTGPLAAHQKIAIVRLGPEVARNLACVRDACRGIADVSEARLALAKPQPRTALGAIMNHVCERYGVAPGEADGGLCVRPPGRVALTINPATGAHIGLHVDNYSRAPLHARKDAENRICVNLGAESRHFHFLNIPVDTIFQLLPQARQNALGELTTAGTRVAREFLTMRPTYPIVSLRIDHGEAYIAPTERLVHDASNLGTVAVDLTLMLRGFFCVPHRNPPT